MAFNIDHVRCQFPALNQASEQNTPCAGSTSTTPVDLSPVYLDSAATSHKPNVVIDAITDYYRHHNANVHRGSHQLTAEATDLYENARTTVQHFIGASSPEEIIWTKGATESINLVAQTYVRQHLTVGDEILVGEMEHHANIVPWQLIAEQVGAKVVKIPMSPDCTLDMQTYKQLLNTKTKIVAVAHITNVTATRQPIESIIKLAKTVGAKTVIDGAQGIIHEKVNVAELDCDFYLFSGHKLYAPTGIGVLYAKQELLQKMSPWQGGGKMVEKVSFSGTTYAEPPARFEAGTPNVSGAIGLATAIRWFEEFEIAEVDQHIHTLYQQLISGLTAIDEVELIGLQPLASVVSFIVNDGDEVIHHQDVATLLDKQHIAVRSGHHCAHPLMDALGINGTVRVSIAIYNNEDDIKRFLSALAKSIRLL